MNKYIWIVIILAIVIVGLLAAFVFLPTKSKPVSPQTGLVVISPKSGEEISLPIKVTGYVDGGGWVGFEGQVGTVELAQGRNVISQKEPLKATSEWTSLPTNFEASIGLLPNDCINPIDCVISGNANLIFHNENPSGDSARDKTFVLPVKIAKSSGETMTVKAFFEKKDEPIGSTCNVVFSVDRVVPKTEAVAMAALEELLKGPTDIEKAQGYFTSIPIGSKLNSILIVNGEARADFDSTTESGGGSCSMAARVAQITQTLMQFPTITSVRLSVDGRTGDVIFQP